MTSTTGSTPKIPSTPLRVFRVARGLRQQDLADLSDVTRNTVALLEKGTQRPHLATAERIAAALGVTVEDVFPPEAS